MRLTRREETKGCEFPALRKAYRLRTLTGNKVYADGPDPVINRLSCPPLGGRKQGWNHEKMLVP
jgi:hypothetical protein